MRYYLVCDGGGSKTEFLLFDNSANVLSAEMGQGANALFSGEDDAATVIENGIRACLGKAGLQTSDLSGAALFIPGFATCLPALERRLGLEGMRLQGDELCAHYGAFCRSPGVLVLSGTGSFAFGLSSKGECARVGGWGPLFGDEGSGYHIGVLALKTVSARYDEGKEIGRLGHLVLQHLGINSVPDLRSHVYLPEFTRRDVAALCPVVGHAARDGDENAMAVLDSAAEALALQAAMALARLGEASLPVSLAGGVSRLGPLFTDRFAQALQKACPESRYFPAKYTPVIGAALWALENMAGVQPKQLFAEKLYSGVKKLC